MPRKTNAFLAELPLFHRALRRWYALHGRSCLPWRHTDDPYAIYVSEIMLQQTQVKTVLERYYGPFLKLFPTLAALAKAPKDKVLKAWEGLGYYNRAANLHRAAQQCDGALPGTVEGLMALPGIGKNTAHAVACFGFGAAVPVMEANVKRVLHRVFALSEASPETLWERAEELLDTKNAFDYNQAMMDVGSLVCTKRRPRCGDCPLAVICKGKAAPELYPAVRAAKQVPTRKQVIVVFGDGKGRYYLAPRESRFLHGLYGFMEYAPGVRSVAFMGRKYPLNGQQRLGAVVQSYSHFTLSAEVYFVPVAGKKAPSMGAVQVATIEEISRLPLSRADSKIVNLLVAHDFC